MILSLVYRLNPNECKMMKLVIMQFPPFSRATIKELPNILWNPKFHYSVTVEYIYI
jgi:hypothetical protein